MPIHNDKHPKAGQTVEIMKGEHAGKEYRVEDWWDRVGGKSWMYCDNNWACMNYGVRSGLEGLPTDNEVVYGKIGAYGHLIHVSEFE